MVQRLRQRNYCIKFKSCEILKCYVAKESILGMEIIKGKEELVNFFVYLQIPNSDKKTIYLPPPSLKNKNKLLTKEEIHFLTLSPRRYSRRKYILSILTFLKFFEKTIISVFLRKSKWQWVKKANKNIFGIIFYNHFLRKCRFNVSLEGKVNGNMVINAPKLLDSSL